MDDFTRLNFGLKLLYSEFTAEQATLDPQSRARIAEHFRKTARALKELELETQDSRRNLHVELKRLQIYHQRLLNGQVRALNQSWLNNCTASSYISNVGRTGVPAEVVHDFEAVHDLDGNFGAEEPEILHETLSPLNRRASGVKEPRNDQPQRAVAEPQAAPQSVQGAYKNEQPQPAILDDPVPSVSVVSVSKRRRHKEAKARSQADPQIEMISQSIASIMRGLGLPQPTRPENGSVNAPIGGSPLGVKRQAQEAYTSPAFDGYDAPSNRYATPPSISQHFDGYMDFEQTNSAPTGGDETQPFYISSISRRSQQAVYEALQQRESKIRESQAAVAESSAGEAKFVRLCSSQSSPEHHFGKEVSAEHYLRACQDASLTAGSPRVELKDTGTNTAAEPEHSMAVSERNVSQARRHSAKNRSSQEESRLTRKSTLERSSIAQQSRRRDSADSNDDFSRTQPLGTTMSLRETYYADEEGDSGVYPNLLAKMEDSGVKKTRIQPNMQKSDKKVDQAIFKQVLKAIQKALPTFAKSADFLTFYRQVLKGVDKFMVFDAHNGMYELQLSDQPPLSVKAYNGFYFIRAKQDYMFQNSAIVIATQKNVYRLDLRMLECHTLICYAPNLVYCDLLHCARLRCCSFTGCSQLRKVRMDQRTCRIQSERDCKFVYGE